MRYAIRDFAGDLVLPGDPAYEEARRTQDETVDRRPAVIARCSGPGDVIAALRYARECSLGVRVRGGGHGPDRFAVDDDALVIDLAPMRGVRVDPAGRRVRVEGGATWREVDAATQAHGLAVTGARLPSVGVAGFMLGSGSGWLERKLGLAADCLRSAQVVTADSRVATASSYEHPDLFWALRGGGPSFGVVTELEFVLHPIDRIVAGLMAWPLERAGAVSSVYAELMAGAPDDLGGALALFNGAPFVPEPLRSAPLVAILIVWTGRGDAPIAPLRALHPAFDLVRRMPYASLQGMFESSEPYTARLRGEGGFLTELSPEIVAVLAEYQLSKPAPEGSILVQPLGGAVARSGARATPLGGRDAPWAYQAGAAWFDSAADAAVSEWAAGLRRALAPYALGGAWPNFIPEQDSTRLRAAFGVDAWEGLQTVRAKWDPDDVFSAGHAITLP